MAAFETENQKMFSIIMATFNCGQKVENSLRSIFSQNPDLFELIVVDGASTDDTLDYLRKYEADFTLISEKDDGVYYAFNKGIELATGKYFYFIGAGDCLKPDILEQIQEFLPADVPSLVYGDFYLMKHQARAGKEFKASYFIADNICHQAIFYHRDIFDIIGKYDLRYKILADWFFNFKCFVHENISKRYVPIIIADFEEGGISTGSDSDLAFKKDFPRLVRQHLGVRLYLICKTFMVNQKIVSFGYGPGYTFFSNLTSFAKPYLNSYKHSKKQLETKR